MLSGLTDQEAVERYDQHLERAEACLDLITVEDPQSVRYKKYAIELFGHLLQVRDALLRLAPGEREGLAAAFGSSDQGCERVARLLVALTGGAEADAEPEGGVLQLQRSGGEVQVILGTGDRLDISQGALRAYKSVAGVLDTLALREAIERVRARRKDTHCFALGLAQKLRQRASVARRSLAARAEEAGQAEEPQEPQAPAEASSPVSPPASTEVLLQRIDAAAAAGECDRAFDKLFAKFDTDGDGELAGEECDAFVGEVAEYVAVEYEQKFSRFNMKLSKAVITEWVRGSLDQDSDGKITRAEIQHLKKIVDDID